MKKSTEANLKALFANKALSASERIRAFLDLDSSSPADRALRERQKRVAARLRRNQHAPAATPMEAWYKRASVVAVTLKG